jgi:hypothetical protein
VETTAQVATAADILVRGLVLNGRATNEETRAIAQRTLRVEEIHLGPDHVELVPSLLNLGDVLIASAEFEPALAVTRRAVATSERRTGPESVAVAEALDHLGDALTGASRYDEAVKTWSGLGLKERAYASSGGCPNVEIRWCFSERRRVRGGGDGPRPTGLTPITLPTPGRLTSPRSSRFGANCWSRGRIEQAVSVAERTLPRSPDPRAVAPYLANTLVIWDGPPSNSRSGRSPSLNGISARTIPPR